MNFKTTIILLALLIVAGGALLLVRRSNEETPAKPEDRTTQLEGRKLFDSPASKDVTRVSITSRDGAKMVFQKSGDKWEIVEPIHAPAEAFAINNLVSDVLSLRSSGRVDAGLAASGLDKPRYQIELQTAGAGSAPGTTVKLDVGDKVSVGDTMYVKAAGQDKADIVPASLYDRLGKPLNDWRDKRLVSVTSSDIKRIDITREDSTLDLRQAGGAWELTAPTKEPVEDSEANSLTSAIANLDAVAFVDPNSAVARTATETPVLTVRFGTGAAATAATRPATAPSSGASTQPIAGGTVLTFGAYDNALKQNVYLRISNPPELVKVPASTLKSFEKTPLDLRDRRVLNIEPDKVSDIALEIDRPATTRPTTKPAEHRTVRIERRKESMILGPVFPGAHSPGSTTNPTTPANPTTASSAPSTQPATQSAAPLAPETPAAAPTTNRSSGARPTTGPVGSVGSAAPHGLPSLLSLVAGEVSATGPATSPAAAPAATQPAAPTTAPAAPATEPAVAPTTKPAPTPATAPTTALAAVPTTGPATAPTTAAAGPKFEPPPLSKWILASEGGFSADDAQVRDLLDALHPLKVEKYLASPSTQPATQPSSDYILTIKTIGAGGAETATYQLRITDPGGEGKLVGHYNDLTFELDRALLKKLDGDFKTKKPPEPVSTPPTGGFPGGGLPGGFHGGQ